jgi:eukaryotic-like serine/threonine-protein kinase
MRDLIRWAKAVADGDPLDPADPASADTGAGARASDPERERLLEQFRILAEIARMHRTAHGAQGDQGADGDAPEAAGTPGDHPAAAHASGPRWGHLTVAERMSHGAFGDVYRAWDARLERFVALKLLYRDDQPDGEGDASSRHAIEEGRLLARLRHPNVVSVYGADRIDGRVGIWMELVDGRTLDDLVSSNGPFSAQEATLVVLDCCRALAAIHQAGLFHRDVKARNVMRERGGRIVVMDLGAGRPSGAPDRQPADADAQSDPHARRDLVGTPLWLAPEIFAGEPASVRSDIYSLGVLLYFLVTGTTPVAGADAAEVFANHQAGRRVPLREARPDLPDDFINTVQRALEPNPQDRFASVAALAESLPGRRAMADAQRRAMPSLRRAPVWRLGWPHRWRLGALAALFAAGAIGALAATMLRGGADAARAEQRVLMPPSPADMRVESVAISPDARTLAFAGPDTQGLSRLWLRPLDAFEARPVPETVGATYPFWSPDGTALGFFARGKLWIVSAAGGAPRVLADAPVGRGATWGLDGRIVFAPDPSSPLYGVPANGGTPIAVTTLDPASGDISHRWPIFLPDGRRIAFLRVSQPPSRSGIFVASTDGAPPRKLLDATTRIAAVRPDAVVYSRGAVLLAQRIDFTQLRPIGEPRVIAPDLAFFPDTRDAVFGIAPAAERTLSAPVGGEALVYGMAAAPRITRFVVHDRAGRVLGSRDVSGIVRSFSISPDGRRLALERLDPDHATDDVWTLDLASDQLVRLTTDPANDTDPIWSPDGREILFASNRQGAGYEMFKRSADPGGADVRVAEAGLSGFPEDWSVRGAIAYVAGHEGARRLHVLAPEQADSSRPLFESTGEQDGPAFSPDGRLIAYHGTESGAAEVFVTRVDDPTRRWQISRGGVQPQWRADGREIVYLAADGALVAAPILAGAAPGQAHPAVRVGSAHPLFATGLSPSFLVNDYVLSPDGQRIIIKREDGGRVARLGLILGWRPPWTAP